MPNNVSPPVEFNPRDILGNIPLDLEHAANGVDVAWHLSGAFDILRRQRGKGVIAPEIRDELMRLMVRAEMAAYRALPSFYERDVRDGMRALAAIIEDCAGPLEEQLAKNDPRRADMADQARILQNICHNAALRENIDARAHARRCEEIEALRGASRRDAA